MWAILSGCNPEHDVASFETPDGNTRGCFGGSEEAVPYPLFHSASPWQCSCLRPAGLSLVGEGIPTTVRTLSNFEKTV